VRRSRVGLDKIVGVVWSPSAEELASAQGHLSTTWPTTSPNSVDTMLYFHITASLCHTVHAVKRNRRWKVPIAYTLKRAAEESGLSIRTLQYAIAHGELESFQVGRRRLIPARSLVQFLSHKKRLTTVQSEVTDAG